MLSTIDTTVIFDHWLWSGITLAVLIWYSTITIYVGIRGAYDIKHMFARLAELSAETPPVRKTPSPPGRE